MEKEENKLDVSERYLLIKWINEAPILDGAKYADSKEDILDYYNSLPRLSGVEYTICRIDKI